MFFKAARFRFGALLTLAVGLAACAVEEPQSDLSGVGMPNSDGIPITLNSNIVAQILGDLAPTLRSMAATLPKDGGRLGADLPADLICQSKSPDETRCRLTYRGPSMNVDLGALFFGIMRGRAFVRRGCDAPSCGENPVRIWWRVVEQRTEPASFDFEICRIEGLEAGLELPFWFVGRLLSGMLPKPNIKGLHLTIAAIKEGHPVLGDDGLPQLDGLGDPVTKIITRYKTLKASAGIGPLGRFPTSSCAFEDGAEPTGAGESKSMAATEEELEDAALPPMFLAMVPAAVVRFVADATHAFAGHGDKAKAVVVATIKAESSLTAIDFRYRGPGFVLPLRPYLGEGMMGRVEVLRPCSNPGCQQKTEVRLLAALRPESMTEAYEVCTASGLEVSLQGMPTGITGLPDFKGAVAVVDRSRQPAVLTKLAIGLGVYGRYPRRTCIIAP